MLPLARLFSWNQPSSFLPRDLCTCSSSCLSRSVGESQCYWLRRPSSFHLQTRFDFFTLAYTRFPYSVLSEQQCCLNKVKDEICTFYFISFAKQVPVAIMSVSESEHHPAGLLAPGPQGPCASGPPPSDNVTSMNTKLCENHLLLHSFRLEDMEILQIPSWFTRL